MWSADITASGTRRRGRAGERSGPDRLIRVIPRPPVATGMAHRSTGSRCLLLPASGVARPAAGRGHALPHLSQVIIIRPFVFSFPVRLMASPEAPACPRQQPFDLKPIFIGGSLQGRVQPTSL